MKAPPPMLDGAHVLLWTSRAEPFYTIWEGYVRHEIVAMAVCRYARPTGSSEQVYLFKCDGEWNVLGDMDYVSIDEAVAAATQWAVLTGDWRS